MLSRANLLFLFLIIFPPFSTFLFFFLNDPPPTKISPLPLHDALPIYALRTAPLVGLAEEPCFHRHETQTAQIFFRFVPRARLCLGFHTLIIHPVRDSGIVQKSRSEEHTSELQSQSNLVCRLLLEQKNI